MKTLLFTVIAFLAITSCNSENNDNTNRPDNSGSTAESFEKIKVDDNFDVYYTQGGKHSVRLDGDDANARIECNGNTLHIYQNGGGHFDDNSNNVDVYVTSPTISGIEMNGEGDFKSESEVTAGNITIFISHSADVQLRSLSCSRIEATATGEGDIDIDRIKADELIATTTNTGNIDLQNATIGKAVCTITGEGDIDIDGHVGQCEQHVTGSGVVDIHD